jgi:hypothetical protein
MSWQLLIWNIFVWSFTGLMIYVNSASMLWLILPALFTGSQNAISLYEKASKEDEYELDEENRKRIMGIVEKSEKRTKSDYRREWL